MCARLGIKSRVVPEDRVNVFARCHGRCGRAGGVWSMWPDCDVCAALPLAARVLGWHSSSNRLVLTLPVFPATLALMPAFVSPVKDAVSAATDEERLIKIHDVIQQLPPPHYRLAQLALPFIPHTLIPRHREPPRFEIRVMCVQFGSIHGNNKPIFKHSYENESQGHSRQLNFALT